MPLASPKGLSGGRRATVPKVRHRTGIHGHSPFCDRRHSTSPGKICPVYG
ncbi:hypothetical protein CSIRO_4246 [Bradyrhizobiaceae bacterium SG-6C]|nr:hypothetical protein CSIRO_4246 [Bradyrhizobiaceae bacterium SG-6C]